MTNETFAQLDEDQPDDVPRPTQVRADAMKVRTHEGGDIDDLPELPAPGSPPTVVDAPAVTVNGSVVTTCNVGDVLTCTNGNWTGEPTDYWQSWLKDAAVVGSGSTYTAQDVDAGASLTCSVTATNVDGDATAVSNAVTVNAEIPLEQRPTPNLDPIA